MRLCRIDLGFPRRLCSDSTCWLVRRPAGMARAYSIDLRERVVAAVEREGLSRHAAAARFGVAPSSAIKWVQRHRATGSVRSEEHTSELQSLMRISYAVFCLKKKKKKTSDI